MVENKDSASESTPHSQRSEDSVDEAEVERIYQERLLQRQAREELEKETKENQAPVSKQEID